MAEDRNRAPGIATLLGRLARTIVGALENRFELAVLEWEEERAQLVRLVAWLAVVLFLGMMGALLATFTIISLFSSHLRIYVAAALAILYLVGAVVAWARVRSLLKRKPFSESIEQARRDNAWLKTFN